LVSKNSLLNANKANSNFEKGSQSIYNYDKVGFKEIIFSSI